MKNKKVDKGLEFRYYKLSYRRRFIRTLWLIPWMLLVLYLMHWLGVSISILVLTTVIFIITAFTQVLYNYKKWKEETELN